MTKANGRAAPGFDLDEYRQELKDAAAEVLLLGFRLVVSEGKNPGHHLAMGGGWQNQCLTLEQAEAIIDRCPHPCIGLQLGEAVDCDIDGEAEQAAYNELFAGVDDIFAPTADTGRGVRQLWATDPRIVATEAATITYKTRDGQSKVTIRTGGGDKGAYSVLPPSRHCTQNGDGQWHWTGRRYRWRDGLDPESVGLPKLPGQVAAKLLTVASASGAKSDGVHSIALAAMRTSTKNLTDESDGSNRLVVACYRLVEHNATDEEAIATIRAYESERPFPKSWTDAEILDRVRWAEQKAVRGSSVVISNFSEIEIEVESPLEPGEQKKKTIVIPKPMSEILTDINKLTAGWPRRVGGVLFVDDPTHGLSYFDKRGPSGMFGWLRRRAQVDWRTGGKYVSQAELFAECERTSQAYNAVELLPHEPALPGIYYRGAAPKLGDGRYLRQLLGCFRPATTVDRDLIQAAFMTVFWGGAAGRRPMFVLTSKHGRGVGKTTVAELIGRLAGGVFDVSAGEEIEKLKTRLLTPAAFAKRVALLDNVKSFKLSWAELESLITAPIISGRQLYSGEAHRPNLVTWFCTLNGVSLATDLAQRSIIIELVRGENTGGWYEKTTKFIDDHREQIIGDILAALQSERFELPSYSRWASWEKDVICRLPEPSEAQRVILERQGEANCELDEGEIIEQYFAEQLVLLGYCPDTVQVRIPTSTAACWFGKAIGEQIKVAAASRRLHQMAGEETIRRLSPDPSRSHGRCFVWTGPGADIINEPIDNSLPSRLADYLNRHER